MRNISSYLTLFILAALLSSTPVLANEGESAARVGQVYEIVQTYKTNSESEDGSRSSSSEGGNALVERVVAVRDSGIELEYDLASDVTKQNRDQEWTFPARVFKPANGPMVLTNSEELESRLAKWLKRAKWKRAVCGRWFFTWTAFKVECDPQSVLKTLADYDMRPAGLVTGMPFIDMHAKEAVPLEQVDVNKGKAVYRAVLVIDPDSVRKDSAASDVIIGEISGAPVKLEDALKAREHEHYSGTITIVIEANENGEIERRTRKSELKTVDKEGKTETEYKTVVTSRKLLLSPSTPQ